MDSVNHRSSILVHVPRVRQFLEAIPKNDGFNASEQGVAMGVQVLGLLRAALSSTSTLADSCRTIPGFSDRRATLRRVLQPYYRDAISFMAAPGQRRAIKKRILKEAKSLCKRMKQDEQPRINQLLIRWKLETLTTLNTIPTTFEDIGISLEG